MGIYWPAVGGLNKTAAINTLGLSQDPRVAWLISDRMRIAGSNQMLSLLGESISNLLGIDFDNGDLWDRTTDHLIAWDMPAPPNYLTYKRNI